MTDTQTDTEVKPVLPTWHRTRSVDGWGWIEAMHCVPDMRHPDHFVITMDGPRGGEHARMHVSRQQLLEMIIAADKERARVNEANKP